MQIQIKLVYNIFLCTNLINTTKVTSNQFFLILMVKERKKKGVESMETLGHGVCFGGTSRDYVYHKKLKMRRMQTISTPSSSEITCKLGNPWTKMVKNLVPHTTKTWKT